MTNKQYEHFGRVVELLSNISVKLEALRRESDTYSLYRLLGGEGAKRVLDGLFCDPYPNFHLANHIENVLKELEGKE